MSKRDAQGKKIETLLSVPDLPWSLYIPESTSKAIFSNNKINAEKEKEKRKSLK